MKSLLLIILISIIFTNAKERSECNLWQDELSSESMQRIVDFHNEKRNKIAEGSENGIGGLLKNDKLPFATNMLQMYWSHELAEKAQEWANNCKFQHSNIMTRKLKNYPVGENLALEYRNYFQPGINWSRAVDIWWAQQSEYLKSGASVDHFEKENIDKVGAFTQMIWANTYMVGCGLAQFRDGNKYSNLYVCHYAPLGNIVSLPIYYSSVVKTSRCPPGTDMGNEKYKGLCCSKRDNYCSKYVITDDNLIENTLPTVVKNYFDTKYKTENKKG